jgi:hypothetical protein
MITLDEHLTALQNNLQALLDLSDGLFPIRIRKNSHLQFMLVSFAAKQRLHALAVLTLRTHLDALLVARSMLEGMSQLLWAAKQPKRRPLMWRAFAYVVDWRLMQENLTRGLTGSDQTRRTVQAGIRRYGRRFWTKEAKAARARRGLMPNDPYLKNWYGERESDLFRDIGADRLLEAYATFSEWHHWRIGGIGRILRFNAHDGQFTLLATDAPSIAEARACAFQAFWETLHLLNSRMRLEMGSQLRQLRRAQLALGKSSGGT